jgi:hypothetical protein
MTAFDDVSARAVVLGSSSPKAFCSGVDLDIEDAERTRVSDTLYELYEKMIRLPVPVVVALDGHAVGAGMQMAVAGDLRVVGFETKMCVAGPKHGLAVAGWGLPALVGRGRDPMVLEALALRDHAAFSVMVYAGLRIEEATLLGVEDLSFTRGAEEVRVARGKGNKERVVPMNPRLKKSLRRYLRVRGALVGTNQEDPGDLFLNEKGTRVSENTVRRRFYLRVGSGGQKQGAALPGAAGR